MNLSEARAVRMRIGVRPQTLYARLIRGRVLIDQDERWGSVEVGTYTYDVSPTELCDDVEAAERELRAEIRHSAFSVALEDGSTHPADTRAQARAMVYTFALDGKRARVIQEEAALA